jgi:hypothetical protein
MRRVRFVTAYVQSHISTTNILWEMNFSAETDPVYTRNVNVAAITANATPACAARPDTAPSANAPPELLPDDVVVLPVVPVAAAAAPEGVRVVESDAEATRGVLAGAFDGTTEGRTTALERGTAEPVPVEVVLPPPGAGTAFDGSTREPLPHAIGSPSGWFALGADTVLPVASEMVKRPVHVLLDEMGEENW